MKRGQVNKYKFTGKERDKETANSNIAGYDYFGARYYDSRIARWGSVDPLAEKYLNYSPYVFVKDNPINAIDPNGMEERKAREYAHRHLLGISYDDLVCNQFVYKAYFLGAGYKDFPEIRNQDPKHPRLNQQDWFKKHGWWKTNLLGVGEGDVLFFHGHEIMISKVENRDDGIFYKYMGARGHDDEGNHLPSVESDWCTEKKLIKYFKKLEGVGSVSAQQQQAQGQSSGENRSLLQRVNDALYGWGLTPQQMWDRMHLGH